MMVWTLCIVGAYCVGSIPFGVLIGRARGIDIREHGSRNIGASNVGRVLGRKLGLVCFGLDVLKGALPVALAGGLAHAIGRDPGELAPREIWLWMAVAAATVIGHMYSLFLQFGGGKGVATGFGAVLAMWPLLTIPGLIAITIWIIVVHLTRYISIASMLAALSLPLTYLVYALLSGSRRTAEHPEVDWSEYVWHASPPLFGTLLIALLVVYRHRGNIDRLRRGEEPKIRSPLT